MNLMVVSIIGKKYGSMGCPVDIINSIGKSIINNIHNWCNNRASITVDFASLKHPDDYLLVEYIPEKPIIKNKIIAEEKYL